jgi:hypothetical protein
MIYAVDMASCGMIYLPGFMKIAAGVKAILRFWLRNLKGCNADITDGRGCDEFIWHDIRTYQVS